MLHHNGDSDSVLDWNDNRFGTFKEEEFEFCSTYMCKSLFSTMKTLYNKKIYLDSLKNAYNYKQNNHPYLPTLKCCI